MTDQPQRSALIDWLLNERNMRDLLNTFSFRISKRV
jgi:hypothetical protein